MARITPLKRAESQLRTFALDYPEAVEEFPWDISAFKVRSKIFLFLSADKNELGLSVKLPKSGKKALKFPFASPTRYGLGKSGWVSARFNRGDLVPIDLLTDWIDESFRTIAPRKIVAYLDFPDEQDGSTLIRSAKTGRQRVKSAKRK